MLQERCQLYQMKSGEKTDALIFHSFAVLASKRYFPNEADYDKAYDDLLRPNEDVRAVRERLSMLQRKRGCFRQINTSDVIVLRRETGTICCFVDGDGFVMLDGFFGLPTSGNPLTLETEHYAIPGKKGLWRVVDNITYENVLFFLLEHEEHGREIPCVILDSNQGMVTVFNGKAAKVAEQQGARYNNNRARGIIMNYDDAATRRVVEMCYRTHKTMLNPIIDWTDEDVWEFIHAYNIPYCELYDTGCTRLGCVGCPMGGYAAQRRELKRWPQYRKLYVSAFDDMLEARRRDGKLNHSSLWRSGEGVMQWWTGYERKKEPGQIGLFSPPPLSLESNYALGG